MNKQTMGIGSIVGELVSYGDNFQVGSYSIIGYQSDELNQVTSIGNEVSIGCYCLISNGVKIGDAVQIEHYCRVDSGSNIGARTRILYGAKVFENVLVGRNCIIGGNLSDRTVVEDNVTYFGEIAHTYRKPGGVEDWDVLIQPSPVIRFGSVIGQNALIIGGVSIGPEAYIGAGEIVRFDVPSKHVLFKGKLSPLSAWRGILEVRNQE